MSNQNVIDDDKYKKRNRQVNLYQRFRGYFVCIALVVSFFIAQTLLKGDSDIVGFKRLAENQVADQRKQSIKQAFRYAFDAYERHAFGFDTLKPLSRTHDEEWFGMATTLIDSLDTAFIMGCDDIVAKGKLFVQNSLAFNNTDSLSNTFEVTIRVLGSLLTMFHFTNDQLYLNKAQELADLMMQGRGEGQKGVFDTRSGIPATSFNFKKGTAVSDQVASTAEATTIQLEWKYLSIVTGDFNYWAKVEQAIKNVFQAQRGVVDGLLPIYISMQDGDFATQEIRLGSRGDSYYEYLVKLFIQTGRSEVKYAQKFEQALDAIIKHLKSKSSPNGYTFVAELPKGRMGPQHPKMDHLVCFLPGTIALYVSHGHEILDPTYQLKKRYQEYFSFAKELLDTCVKTYTVNPTGLAPEIVYFRVNPQSDASDILINDMDAHNILRPETVESLFYMWRITKDEVYREQAWAIFEAFEQHCKVPLTSLEGGGYAALSDVRQIPAPQRDRMESFFLSETLKYLYLIFCDDSVLPLTDYVFNTEAHPFPIVDLSGYGSGHEELIKKIKQSKLGLF